MENTAASGKGLAYEEDIRVPFLVRGPGIPSNFVVDQMTANIDFAPRSRNWPCENRQSGRWPLGCALLEVDPAELNGGQSVDRAGYMEIRSRTASNRYLS